jgi:hypothetical protein
MTEDTPEGQDNQRPEEHGLPPWNARTELYVSGVTSPRYRRFDALAAAWLNELPRVVPRTYGQKVAGELSYPPDYDQQADLRTIRLGHGQVITLQLDAYAENLRGDHRWFRRVEVRAFASRTDKATLAALCVLEGSGVGKQGLDRIREYLRGDRVELELDEERLITFARELIRHHRPGFDLASADGIGVLIKTCEGVVAQAEGARQSSDLLEFGAADRHTRKEIEDAQLDMYAAELHHICGMSQQQVAKKMALKISDRDKDKGGHRTAASRIKRGTDLFVRALGKQEWERYKSLRRAEYEKGEGTPP